MQPLAPELNSDHNPHSYSPIHFFFSFVIPVNLAPSLGLLQPFFGARSNKFCKHLHLNWNLTQIPTPIQLSGYLFDLSFLLPLHHIRVSYRHSLVQVPTSQTNTCTWIEIQPKYPHLFNLSVTFFICHPCHPCTTLGFPTAIPWCKAQQVKLILAPELKSNQNVHSYPTIRLLFLFVIPVTLAPSLGFPMPFPGASPNKSTKHFHLNWNLTQIPTSIQPSTYFFYLSSLSPLHHIRVSHCHSLVQGPTSQANTWTWIEIQPKCTHLPNYPLTFFICHLCHPCTLIRVSHHSSLVQVPTSQPNTCTWIEIQPKCTHLPNHPLTFFICHPCHPCAILGFPTAVLWCKAQQVNQTLAPELKSNQNLHIYLIIYLLFSFVIPITLAPSLGFPLPFPGARLNKPTKQLHMNWILTQMHTSTQPSHYIFDLSSLSPLHPL